ncbi:MAG: hypothetical protein RSA24_02335 [Clostridia bacterium]
MNEKIDKMLDGIVDRIEIALPNTTSIAKVIELADLLISIKNSTRKIETPIAQISVEHEEEKADEI